jgi:hypothetical protein
MPVRSMRRGALALSCVLLTCAASAHSVQPSRAAADHLTFQTSQPWSSHVNADTVLDVPSQVAIRFGAPAQGK